MGERMEAVAVACPLSPANLEAGDADKQQKESLKSGQGKVLINTTVINCAPGVDLCASSAAHEVCHVRERARPL